MAKKPKYAPDEAPSPNRAAMAGFFGSGALYLIKALYHSCRRQPDNTANPQNKANTYPKTTRTQPKFRPHTSTMCKGADLQKNKNQLGEQLHLWHFSSKRQGQRANYSTKPAKLLDYHLRVSSKHLEHARDTL